MRAVSAAAPPGWFDHAELQHYPASGGHQAARPAPLCPEPVGNHEFALGPVLGGQKRYHAKNFGVGGQPIELQTIDQQAVHDFSSTALVIPNAAAGLYDLCIRQGENGITRAVDRKRTRLNSSHRT